MIISDNTLKEYIKKDIISIKPLDDIQIQPASIDLRLSEHFMKVDEENTEYLSLDKEASYKHFNQNDIMVPPHSFMLASTIEYIKLPSNITAFVEGRSSIGRMGLFIENAGWVDAGFEGTITLEIYNANRLPIKISAKKRICQLVFSLLDDEAKKPYCGKYQKQKGTTSSRSFLDMN